MPAPSTTATAACRCRSSDSSPRPTGRGDLQGELILEVGSGSGRFTEQAANTGATVVSLDYSYAVEANYASNGARANVLIVQADVFAMPFRSGTFDRVFCFGMLQHTPDPARGLCGAAARAAQRRYAVRGHLQGHAVSRIPADQILRATVYPTHEPRSAVPRVCAWVNFMWPLASLIRRLPKGYAINWRLLVADYSFLGLEGEMLKEWSYLDTFDMLAPRYDRPATHQHGQALGAAGGSSGRG